MPGFDRKGPEGEGPMTGRKLGRCKGNTDSPRNLGRGAQDGRGRKIRGSQSGRGLGRRFKGNE